MTKRLGRHAALRPMLLTVLLALLLAGPVSPAGAAGQAGNADFQAPSVGECHALTIRQVAARSEKSTPVPCSKAHTTRTVAVAHLPAKYDWRITDLQLFKVVLRTCYPAWGTSVAGGYARRHLTAYSYAWFVPGKTQRAKGARWIRCDQDLFSGSSLHALPTDRTPALRSGAIPDSQARCLKAKTFYPTACDQAHAFRASGTFTVASTTFPGRATLAEAATHRCPSLVGSRQYRYTWRDKLTWRIGGDHTVACYTKTTG